METEPTDPAIPAIPAISAIFPIFAILAISAISASMRKLHATKSCARLRTNFRRSVIGLDYSLANLQHKILLSAIYHSWNQHSNSLLMLLTFDYNNNCQFLSFQGRIIIGFLERNYHDNNNTHCLVLHLSGESMKYLIQM